jgi:hypothetical protein
MEKIIGRAMPDGTYIEAHVEVRESEARLSDGFSVSGLLWRRRGTWTGERRRERGLDSDAAGQITEELAAAFPQLAPIMHVHLADLDGVPMFARTNGWYFYTGAAREYETRIYSAGYAAQWGTDHERAARALRTPPADLPEGLDEDGFAEFAEAQRPRWAEEAKAARAAFDAL